MKIRYIYEDGHSQVEWFLRTCKEQSRFSKHYLHLFEGIAFILDIAKELPELPKPVDSYVVTAKTAKGLRTYHPFKELNRTKDRLSIYEMRYNHMYHTDSNMYWGVRILFFQEVWQGEPTLFLARGLIKYQTEDHYLNMKSKSEFNHTIDQTFMIYLDFLENPKKYERKAKG